MHEGQYRYAAVDHASMMWPLGEGARLHGVAGEGRQMWSAGGCWPDAAWHGTPPAAHPGSLYHQPPTLSHATPPLQLPHC